MQVLVTGAAGYLGSVLCETLLAAGHGVTALDALAHGVPSLLHLCAHPHFEFVRGDARDEGLMRQQLKGADAVLGMTQGRRSPWLPPGILIAECASASYRPA